MSTEGENPRPRRPVWRSKTSPNSSSISRRMRSKLANRSREDATRPRIRIHRSSTTCSRETLPKSEATVMRMKRLLLLSLLALLAFPAVATAGGRDDDDDDDRGRHHPPWHKKKDVKVQLLGLNDFHGALEPPTGSGGRVTTPTGNVDAGGVEYFATHVRALEKGVKNSLVVSAGDLIGATPFTSALFHDEPTIEAMNKIGLDINGVGNHEFDEGEEELLRMQYGGCHPTDTAGTCKDADGRFDGARVRVLAANVVRRDTGRPLLAPYKIKRFGRIKVGFIGM